MIMGGVVQAREHLRRNIFSCQVGGAETTLTCSQKRVYSVIKDLLEHTILRGEGDSMVIVGDSGVGKTWIVNEVLQNLSLDPKYCGNFLQVKLNGMVHMDDRLALLDVARQLDLEDVLGDKITISFSSALSYVLDALKTGSRAKQSIIFVLDEFHLFALHKDQTLLYNLFDLAKAGFTPIAVIGITHQEDAVELLEKRVKSRFSHKTIELHSDSFEEYVKVFKTLLSLPDDFEDHKFLREWSEHLEELVQNNRLLRILRHQYDGDPNIHRLKQLLVVPICRLSSQHIFIEPADLDQSLQMISKDPVEIILSGISILELCLVIAMNHIKNITGNSFNFEMVYNEYKKFTQRSQSVTLFSKPVAMKAFEHLLHLEFVCPAESMNTGSTFHGSGKTMKEFRQMILTLKSDQIRSAVKNYPDCPTDISRWGTSATFV